MNYEILDALSQITREKSVERQNLIETLEAGLVSAGRKKFGPTANIQVTFDNASGAILMHRVMDVVETVEKELWQRIRWTASLWPVWCRLADRKTAG